MATTLTSHISSTNLTHLPHRPRMPKLKYRSASAVIGIDTNDDQKVSQERQSPQEPPVTDSEEMWRRRAQEPLNVPRTTSQIDLATILERLPADKTPKPKAKKSAFAGLRSLMATREPSSLAFAQLEEQAKKATKKDKSQGQLQITLPGVSTAKLPSTVPPVNSRWDGVPQSVKEKEKEAKKGNRPGSKSSGSRTSGSRPTTGQRTSTVSSDQISRKRTSAFSGSSDGRSDTRRGRSSQSSHTNLGSTPPSLTTSVTPPLGHDARFPDEGFNTALPPVPVFGQSGLERADQEPQVLSTYSHDKITLPVRAPSKSSSRQYPLDLRRNNSLTSLPEELFVDIDRLEQIEADDHRASEKPDTDTTKGNGQPKISKNPRRRQSRTRPTAEMGSSRAATRPPRIVSRDRAVAPWEEPESIFGPQCAAPVIRSTPNLIASDKTTSKSERVTKARRSRVGFFG
ncbi:MAG: hypothetical protein M1814_006072 [Vezdaea aestivalis]|nr:MAG: hypothetical protein M1814_006072 [Vezdaea aestivalis]